MADSDNKTKQNADSVKAEVSLAEELQSIVSSLSGAETDAEAEKGLLRLKRLREEFGASPASVTARERAEELISRAEERVEKLRRYLAHKRRIQEGELMEKVAARREAESDVIGAVAASAAAAAAAAPSPVEDEKEAPEKTPEAAPAAKVPPAPAKQEPVRPVQEAPVQQEPAKEPPAPIGEEPKLPEHAWNRTYRLTAHMAASFTEDGKYFEKLRRSVKKAGPKLPAPNDHAAAEAYYKSVHGLNVRLVNIELKVRAIAEASKKNEPVSELFKTASNEIKGFMQDLKADRERQPEMQAEYERLFGGYAEKFASLPALKGGELLERCLTEQHHNAPEANRGEPQRVLARDDR